MAPAPAPALALDKVLAARGEGKSNAFRLAHVANRTSELLDGFARLQAHAMYGSGRLHQQEVLPGLAPLARGHGKQLTAKMEANLLSRPP